ncbi:His-Xaa-Ser system protein HxsD [Acidithiobacillus ferrivorans]|nr:His-Xaa-Ser system protein HxsD [Acidithiobacillus ferrivorans]
MSPYILSFDATVYVVEAVQKAAYRFIGRLAANISIHGSDIVCTITLDHSASEEAVAVVLQDFTKEVLDQQLRFIIKKETEQERNLILGLAFSRSGLQSIE